MKMKGKPETNPTVQDMSVHCVQQVQQVQRVKRQTSRRKNMAVYTNDNRLCVREKSKDSLQVTYTKLSGKPSKD